MTTVKQLIIELLGDRFIDDNTGTHRYYYMPDLSCIVSDGNNFITYLNENGKCHRTDGPARFRNTHISGQISTEWYENGNLLLSNDDCIKMKSLDMDPFNKDERDFYKLMVI